MGAAGSSVADIPGGELRLPETKLRFSTAQLRTLNLRMDQLQATTQHKQMSVEMEGVMEALVQRLVDGAGQKDPRFRCQHLIALHKGKRLRSRSLEYLVPLDALPVLNSGSEECFLVESPAGHGRIQLSGTLAEQWAEFLTPTGYLCRDKVVERWVQLVASCASSQRAGTSSRVLDPRAAPHALPGAGAYCYLQTASSSALSPEQRLAIVEGGVWVCVRVGSRGAASGAASGGEGDGEAKLALAVRGAGSLAAPRTPLTHPMALLMYTAAATGFYAVAVGPPTSLACPDRQASWQLWQPVMEATLETHLAEYSGVARVAYLLNALVDHLREGFGRGSIRMISRYAVSRALRQRIECMGEFQARYWLGIYRSHHVLAVLDAMVWLCEHRDSICLYSRRGLRAGEVDWRADAACLRAYLAMLHADTARVEEVPLTMSQTLEMVLFRRWEGILRESRSLKSTTSQPVYSQRQMKYIWRVAKQLLTCKKSINYEKRSAFHTNLIQVTSLSQEPIEDLIHVLAIILDQAKDLYIRLKFPKAKPSSDDFDKENTTYKSKKINKFQDYYNVSCSCLIDAVRRDLANFTEELIDLNLVKFILKWLYQAIKDDKKYLGPVLKIYLDKLYVSSLENCWFLDDFDSKRNEREFEGLRKYCLAVHDGLLDPNLGLLDAAQSYAWATAIVHFIEKSKDTGLQIVFPEAEGGKLSFPVQLPPRAAHGGGARALTLTRRDKAEAKTKLARRCVLSAFVAAFADDCKQQKISKCRASEEFLHSTKSGQFWRNESGPDVIPRSLDLTKMSKRRKARPQYPGYPDFQGTLTTKNKYHTLKSLVFGGSMENVKELRERPRSAGSTLKIKEPMTRPSILETLDFINGVKNALCVEESGTSDVEDTGWSPEDDALLREVSPLNFLARMTAGDNPHMALGNILVALMAMGRYTVLQELCSWLGEAKSGALYSLHRLAKTTRSRSTERGTGGVHCIGEGSSSVSCLCDSNQLRDESTEPPERYKVRPPDYLSADESRPPPPVPKRHASKNKVSPQQRYSDYVSPRRLQQLELELSLLEALRTSSVPLQGTLAQVTRPQPMPYSGSSSLLNEKYTGIINPMYGEVKMAKDKFSKRSRSVGRSFSSRSPGALARYLTVGAKGRDLPPSGDLLPCSVLPSRGDLTLWRSSNVVDSLRISKMTIE